MSTHTPGPWKAVNQTTSTLLKQDGPKGAYLFTLKEWPGIAEAEANARLIAAAPDLLAALKAAMDALHYVATLESAPKNTRALAERDLNIARAAIAKAEGTS